MKRLWTIGLFLFLGLSTTGWCGPRIGTLGPPAVELTVAQQLVSERATGEHVSPGPRQHIEEGAPQRAYDILTQLQQRDGRPLPGYVGGKEFRNREHRLPRGRYREYDVNRKIPGRSRDAERLVIEQETGKAYYTGDHYRTFIPLN